MLSLSTIALVARVDAAIELKNTTFYGVATASIHCTIAADSVLVDYEGPVSMEMTTRVEVNSGGSSCPRVSYLNVRFAFMTLDSALITSANTGEHRRSVVHCFSAHWASSGNSPGWPYPVFLLCTQQKASYYAGMRCPEAMGQSTQEFGLCEFETTASGSFRLCVAPYDSSKLMSGESPPMGPTALGPVLLVGEGTVAVTESTWGLMKQRFME
jgi:hypothetical protein